MNHYLHSLYITNVTMAFTHLFMPEPETVRDLVYGRPNPLTASSNRHLLFPTHSTNTWPTPTKQQNANVLPLLLIYIVDSKSDNVHNQPNSPIQDTFNGRNTSSFNLHGSVFKL